MSEREHVFQPTDPLSAPPGPGAYNLKFANYRPPGGGSMANKSKRFGKEMEINPGPGKYNLSKESDWLKTKVVPGSKNNSEV